MTKMNPAAQKAFIFKAKDAIFDKTYALNDALAFDLKTKTTILADLAGIIALVTKRVLENNPSEKMLSVLSSIDKNTHFYEGLLMNPKSLAREGTKQYQKMKKDEDAFVTHKIEQELLNISKDRPGFEGLDQVEGAQLRRQFEEQFDRELKEKEGKQNELDQRAGDDLLSDKKELEALASVIAQTLYASEGQFHPHAVFHAKIACLVLLYAHSDCEEADKKAFKTNFKAAVDSFSLAYRKVGKSEAADYIKAMGVALLGTLVALITSPMLLVSSGHRHWIGTFFAGPETDESKKVQKELDDKFVDDLLSPDGGPEGGLGSSQMRQSRNDDAPPRARAGRHNFHFAEERGAERRYPDCDGDDGFSLNPV